MTTIAMRRTTAPIALPLWLLFAWLSTAPFNAAEAAPILDNGFGNSGVVRLNVAGESVVSPAAIVIPQGGQLTVVATTSTIDSSQLVVQQYLPTGAIDGNFGVGGRVALPESLHCMARPGAIVPSSGETVVIASASPDATCTTANVVGWALSSDGSRDGGYRITGLPTMDKPYAATIALDTLGNALVAGVSAQGTSSETYIARLTNRGGIDPQFAQSGLRILEQGVSVANREVRIAILPNGHSLTAVLAGTELRLAEFDDAGRPVPFPDGKTSFTIDFRLYAPNGEQLRLVDFFRLADGANLAIVQRRSANANGLLIARTAQNPRYYGTSLLIGITGPAEWPVALALNDGSVVIAEVVGSGQSRTAKLRRMFANSSFDVTWGPDQAYALGINLTVTALAHDELGRLLVAGTDGNGGFVRRYDLTLRPDFVKTFAQEFYNSGLKHYFVTAEQPEVQAILRGAAGPDWTQTFRGFRVYPISPNPPPDSKPVCRFYGNRTIDPLSGKPYGPNSHVFVLDGAECEAVKFDVGWAYEGIAYYIHEPVNGSCAFWQTPVYRVYNNRAGQNDSNHRFVTSTSLYAQMTSQGWKGEGIVMCAP